ncbi:hypothetical protein ANN_19661 [Periplaneta americana]|uniref:PiggyBac transposable element-derived protein domain-containing protein n=1 Tax=Periplaneta americana TaxID=6978 RepID=A0ABQ8SAI9_PERAM|nr:hypothetical protein ANN_19661 [Periplaneta americana]
MHQGASVSESGLPEIIEFYNSTKGGVDMFDQMCSTYSCNRKTQRWPLCVFYGIINSSCLNAYVILRHNMTTVGAHVQPREMFLLSLGEAMMTPWIEKRLVMQNLPRLIRENIADQLGKNVPETSTTLQGEGAKRRCHLCPRSKDRKSKIQCSESNLKKLEAVKASYLKRALQVSRTTQTRLVYLLMDTDFFVRELMTSNGLQPTPAYDAHVRDREEKAADVDQEFLQTPAMNTEEWKKPNFELRHVFTRTAAHGFHHRICAKRGYHSASEQCICTLCRHSCSQYHILTCQARTNTLTFYAKEDNF